MYIYLYMHTYIKIRIRISAEIFLVLTELSTTLAKVVIKVRLFRLDYYA